MEKHKEALIFGATGNVGGAAARELLRRGWRVRAVTRDTQSERAQRLKELGARLVEADMNDSAEVEAAVQGAQRVLSVQNWTTSGVEGEERQARTVVDAVKKAGVKHLVYCSAGVGVAGTGIPHFENKIRVEATIRHLGLPVTIVRPSPFMELMIAKEFYPSLSTWGTMPRVVGRHLPIPWVAVEDIGLAVANIFAAPDTWIGRELNLIGDVLSLDGCRDVFRKVRGRRPLGLPLPPALFRKMGQPEMVDMWHWFVHWTGNGGAVQIKADSTATRELIPAPLSVENWLRNAGASSI